MFRRFLVQHYRTDLSVTLSDGSLFVEGYVWDEYKFLKFLPQKEMIVSSKFRGKSVQAKLIRFTADKAVIEYQGKERRDSLSDFVMNNRFTEICVRIEKNGTGPYNFKEGSEKLKLWQEDQRRILHQRREHGLAHIQPSPGEDSLLSDYPLIATCCQFGFSSYEQMFKWFTLEEISFFRKENFQVVIKQKGLDYFESFKSHNQVAMAASEKDYQEILSLKRSIF